MKKEHIYMKSYYKTNNKKNDLKLLKNINDIIQKDLL